MASKQPAVVTNVILLAFHAARAPTVLQGTSLTPQDRITVTRWQERARLAGFDRMVIHDRDNGDACDVGNFLSVHLSGQAWSRWGFARAGDCVRAWCCLTGADVGEFSSLSEALEAVLMRGAAGTMKSLVTTASSATNLIPFNQVFRRGLGSAA